MTVKPTTPSPTVVIRQTRRAHTCFLLPEGFEPLYNEERQEKFRAHVMDLMGLDYAHVHYKGPFDGVYQIVIVHGKNGHRRTATYENGVLGSISYTAKQSEQLIIDANHRLLYVTQGTLTREFVFALNGTLFPDRTATDPFYFHTLDLERVLFWNTYNANPVRNLCLKCIGWHEPGREADPSSKKWVRNGFPELTHGTFKWPSHVDNVGLSFTVDGYRRPRNLLLLNDSGGILTTLTIDALPYIGKMLHLCASDSHKLLI